MAMKGPPMPGHRTGCPGDHPTAVAPIDHRRAGVAAVTRVHRRNAGLFPNAGPFPTGAAAHRCHIVYGISVLADRNDDATRPCATPNPCAPPATGRGYRLGPAITRTAGNGHRDSWHARYREPDGKWTHGQWTAPEREQIGSTADRSRYGSRTRTCCDLSWPRGYGCRDHHRCRRSPAAGLRTGSTCTAPAGTPHRGSSTGSRPDRGLPDGWCAHRDSSGHRGRCGWRSTRSGTGHRQP